MPRQGRIDVIGGVYHLIIRGINRGEIFKDVKDREELIARFQTTLKDSGTICYGWALMSNHFHLLVKRAKSPISEMMRRLLTGYAVYYNRRHRRTGYLFQNRYKSILCDEEKYLLELVRYIHLNPVRSKIVSNVQKLGKYPWSGYSALTGRRPREFQETGEILGRFGGSRGRALKKLEEFMLDGLKGGRRDDLTGGGLRRSAGGWQGIAELKRNKEYWRGDERILGNGAFVEHTLKHAEQTLERREALRRKGYTLKEVLRRVCDHFQVSEGDLRRKGRKNRISEARSVFAYLGNRELGISCSDLARELGCSGPAVSVLVRQGEALAQGGSINLLS